MQQILKFEIEFFDVRTNQTLKINNDATLVKSISIRKDVQLNNVATIAFNKPKAYSMQELAIEERARLYNYVKMKLTLINSEGEKRDAPQDFYFSGFITDVRKAFQFGDAPDFSFSITIADFSTLIKNTFYTKNLTFLDILNQAIPEFRLINFSDVFGKDDKDLINNFYDPNQLGFVFFCFFYFKFFLKMTYTPDKKKKTAGGKQVFKDFKLFMPFSFDETSLFARQASSLLIYKQLQGVAWDLFKYLYPEPIFEFNSFETEDSVILIIRPTPFMSFERPTTRSVSLKTSSIDIPGFQVTETFQAGANDFDVNMFKTIEDDDFGFEKIKEFNRSAALGQYIRNHNIDTIREINKSIGDTFKIEDLIPNDKESNLIVDSLYNINYFDIRLLRNFEMSKQASSVVNLIWTTPVTMTAILNASGRSLVFAAMQDKLQASNQDDPFKEYLLRQFEKGYNANPVFLMNYQNMFDKEYVSGDINYFGMREFEVKWNYLNLYDTSISNVLSFVNQDALKQIRATCKDKKMQRFLNNMIAQEETKADKRGKFPIPKVTAQDVFKDAFSRASSNIVYDWKPSTPKEREAGFAKIVSDYNPAETKNKSILTNDALNNPEFLSSLKRLGISPSEFQNLKTLRDLIRTQMQKSQTELISFANRLNSIVAKAYRENEHLYSGRIATVINLGIIPGQILFSDNPNPVFNKPSFKGYVTSSTHTIDFNSASFSTVIDINRAALDDSGLVIGTQK